MSAKPNKRLLVVQVAGLGYDFLCKRLGSEQDGLAFAPLDSVFPAVTCPTQASFRTGRLPSVHGTIANGFYDRTLHRVLFWEQSAALVEGPRLWDAYRRRGGRVAMLFWQQCLGEDVDLLLSPAPLHKHHGGMIEDCYGRPSGLYALLCRAVGRPFRLRHYWGPLASVQSSQWIAEATAALLADSELAPDLCLTYLPGLDYDLQRYGPDHQHAGAALAAVWQQLTYLHETAAQHGYEFLIFGDYAITACPGGAVFPNHALREAGLLSCRRVAGRAYLDTHTSRALAVVDHQVAHVYVRDSADLDATVNTLQQLPGIAAVVPAAEALGAPVHARAGKLIATADSDCWLAYPWWSASAEEPDYARHVDIHRKPGYDPCELFWGWPPGSVSRRPERVLGTHGLSSNSTRPCWAASVDFVEPPRDIAHLAALTRTWLESESA